MSDFRHRAEPVVKRSRSIHKGQERMLAHCHKPVVDRWQRALDEYRSRPLLLPLPTTTEQPQQLSGRLSP